MKQAQAKHKLCRRLGYCIWNMAKCPSVKRPYPAGQQGKNGKKKKLSTYGESRKSKPTMRLLSVSSETSSLPQNASKVEQTKH